VIEMLCILVDKNEFQVRADCLSEDDTFFVWGCKLFFYEDCGDMKLLIGHEFDYATDVYDYLSEHDITNYIEVNMIAELKVL
jgi:hypothetical protein